MLLWRGGPPCGVRLGCLHAQAQQHEGYGDPAGGMYMAGGHARGGQGGRKSGAQHVLNPLSKGRVIVVQRLPSHVGACPRSARLEIGGCMPPACTGRPCAPGCGKP